MIEKDSITSLQILSSSLQIWCKTYLYILTLPNLFKQAKVPIQNSIRPVLEIIIIIILFFFFADRKYLLPGIKASSKTRIPGSKNWSPINSPLISHPSTCEVHDQTKFVKITENAFGLMELC